MIDINGLISKFKSVHGEKYIYDLVIGEKYNINIFCIKCNKWFLQNIYKHKKGHNCPSCVGGVVSNAEEFIKKSIGKHGRDCDYSEVVYKNHKTKVKLMCKIHNFTFYQCPNDHLSKSIIFGCKGCPICAENIKLTSEEFILRSVKIYGDKYDYSDVRYINQKSKVNIRCKDHNYIFSQTPSNHIFSNKEGCNKCKKYPEYDTEIFIFKSNKKHRNKYLYDKSVFTGRENDIIVECRAHGFFIIKPFDHLRGTRCPKCIMSIGEERIMDFLEQKDIKFKYEKTFDECVDKNPLWFDFYLPEYNMVIEYDGQQHYISIENWGGINKLNDNIRKDTIKNKYCEDNNIRILRIPYWDFDNIEVLIKNDLNLNEN